MSRHAIVLGAVFCFLAVALGAFGTHSLKTQISADALEQFKTGAQYQFLHGIGLIAIGAIRFNVIDRRLEIATFCFTIGIVIFAGSLYGLALSGIRWLGAITPIGGGAFLIGWFVFGAGRARNGDQGGFDVKIALGTDHAGFATKEIIRALLDSMGHEVVDFGTFDVEPCDYPDFCHPAARAVASGECDRGIVFGGSGNGEAMVANRHKGVRCALCWSEESASLARQHNNANMISIGGRMVDPDLTQRIVQIWLETEFEGGRHVARIQKIDDGA